MNKNILENKISDLLGVSEDEKNLAFSLFKTKLSSFLKVGEALRISELGVFQLKEKLDHTDESIVGGKSSNLTLVFSPISDDQSSSDSLFVNLEIEKPTSDDTAFNENVFQLGIGKPLVTNMSDSIEGGDQIKSNAEKIEEKVSSILEKSEKLDGYDLWEDYLERKETKNILNEPQNSDLAIDSIIDESDEEIKGIDLNVLDEDFIPKEEDDILDDYLEDTNFLSEDELETVTDQIGTDDIEMSDSIVESIEIEATDKQENEAVISDLESDKNNLVQEDDSKDESVIDKIEEEIEQLEVIDKLSFDDSDEISETDEMNNEVNNEIAIPDFESENNEVFEGELKDESIIEKIDEEIEQLEDMDKLSIEEPIYGDELDEVKESESHLSSENEIDEQEDENISEALNDINEKKEFEENDFDAEKLGFEDQPVSIPDPQSNKPNRKSLVLLLLAAFIIIGAIAIYYTFFNNSSIVKNKAITEVALAEDKNNNETENEPTLNSVEKTNPENGAEVLNESEEEVKPKIDKTPLVSKEISKNTTTEESEVSDNIYFDGFVYNVQVSSWRQERIAEDEVNKLVKRGFPAYKVEIYISKFKGTWYRVRIGPFPSLIEAQESKKKVNK